MILPVVKLGTLALKTMCKPIASRLKKEAGKHPKFRNIIVNLAQANHRISTNVQRRIYGHSTNVEIRPLNEEKAVQAAADLLGELFVFSVAGGAVIFEVQRSARSEARKEEMRKQEIEVEAARETAYFGAWTIKQKEEELVREVELLKVKLNEIEHYTKGRGFADILKFKSGQTPEDSK